MGFTFDAVADDEDAARTVGVNVPAYKLTAFGIGTALAGLAGGLYIYFAHIILPDTFDFVQSIAILTMVVIGGTGSVWGVVVALDRAHAAARSVSRRGRLPAPDLRRHADAGDALQPGRPRGLRPRRPGAATGAGVTVLAEVRDLRVRFRRRRCGRRVELRRRSRRVPGGDRPQRRRQDHRAQDGCWRAAPRFRARLLPGRGCHAPAGACPGAARAGFSPTRSCGHSTASARSRT